MQQVSLTGSAFTCTGRNNVPETQRFYQSLNGKEYVFWRGTKSKVLVLTCSALLGFTLVSSSSLIVKYAFVSIDAFVVFDGCLQAMGGRYPVVLLEHRQARRLHLPHCDQSNGRSSANIIAHCRVPHQRQGKKNESHLCRYEPVDHLRRRARERHPVRESWVVWRQMAYQIAQHQYKNLIPSCQRNASTTRTRYVTVTFSG